MNPPSVRVFGLDIVRVDRTAALRVVESLYHGGEPTFLAFANAHTLNLAYTDPHYMAVLRRAGAIFNDGSGVALAGRLWGAPFPANLNGSDFNPMILELAADRGWSVYLLGSRAGVAERAAERLRAGMPGLVVAGCHQGFLRDEDGAVVAEKIRASGADLVMVAMGNPAQEIWLDRHLRATGARLGVGVGAFLDFSAGLVPRAPAWMSRAGVEWIYRLWLEPERLWRRYLLGIPVFLARVLRERVSRAERR